jgi:TatD DNase family protein
MYIDTHVQLNFSDFDEDRDMVIGNAKKAGVKQFIIPGVDFISCESAITLAKSQPGKLFAAVGFHPYEAPKNPSIATLESFLADPHNRIADGFPVIVAIGECGLDYHIYKGEMAAGKKDVQQTLLKEQLLLALNHDLPVIIHCREAFEDLFTVLASLPKMPRGVIHCFSGGLQDLRIALEMGFYVGIDGNVTYAKHLSVSVPHIPLSRLLLETDAPYLTPEPHRGTRNEPKYIPLIAQKIADFQGVPVAAVADATTANAKALFGI